MPSHLKKRVRTRMQQTGESYQQALRNVRAQAVERCGATSPQGAASPQGLTCGLEKGHTGDHNALGWGVRLPGEITR